MCAFFCCWNCDLKLVLIHTKHAFNNVRIRFVVSLWIPGCPENDNEILEIWVYVRSFFFFFILPQTIKVTVWRSWKIPEFPAVRSARVNSIKHLNNRLIFFSFSHYSGCPTADTIFRWWTASRNHRIYSRGFSEGRKGLRTTNASSIQNHDCAALKTADISEMWGPIF